MIEVGGDVDEVHQRLLRQVPLDPGVWRELASKYVGVPVGFSIYAEAAP